VTSLVCVGFRLAEIDGVPLISACVWLSVSLTCLACGYSRYEFTQPVGGKPFWPYVLAMSLPFLIDQALGAPLSTPNLPLSLCSAFVSTMALLFIFLYGDRYKRSKQA
jgi:hypothetical protein